MSQRPAYTSSKSDLHKPKELNLNTRKFVVMRNFIIPLIICLSFACENGSTSKTSGDIVTNKFQKEADIDFVKNLISGSFQAIWTDYDSSAIPNYFTKDFMLFEDGMIWNNDSIAHYLRIKQQQSSKSDYKRINRFDFLNPVHSQNSVWIVYENYAAWIKGKDTVRTAHWSESVMAIKENNKWKLQRLHSTTVKK
ncbi:MAG: hypothetical protein ACJA08_002282 [Cyclobacteriaceae bacterium]|jgi:hypothetical protein